MSVPVPHSKDVPVAMLCAAPVPVYVLVELTVYVLLRLSVRVLVAVLDKLEDADAVLVWVAVVGTDAVWV